LYQKSIFIFRRDLRLQDNTGLLAALKNSKQVALFFIFTPGQTTAQNKYLSENALQFMLESLSDLEIAIKNAGGKIYFFYGAADQIIKNLITQIKPDAIFTNQDYTPFSLERDDKIKALCEQHQVAFCQTQDLLLCDPDQTKTKTGKIYQVFTAFYKNAQNLIVREPNLKTRFHEDCFYNKPISGSIKLREIYQDLILKPNLDLVTNGGTPVAHKILKNLVKFKNYAQTHDFPALASTHLSAHLKFGTVSIREVFYSMIKNLGSGHTLIRQLYWRDFFTYIAYHNKHVFGHAFNQKYDQIKWSHDAHKFKLWCAGKTGFPIVDAGMRELNHTGFMHNRVRMITASFLVKDLQIDWQLGEKYFAQKLAEYDPAVNNGNWQWVAGTGCDAQPYFRVFNPWIQQKKFDLECVYIKTWLPELKLVSPKIIHAWFKQQDLEINYPKPILDHNLAAKQAVKLYG